MMYDNRGDICIFSPTWNVSCCELCRNVCARIVMLQMAFGTRDSVSLYCDLRYVGTVLTPEYIDVLCGFPLDKDSGHFKIAGVTDGFHYIFICLESCICLSVITDTLVSVGVDDSSFLHLLACTAV